MRLTSQQEIDVNAVIFMQLFLREVFLCSNHTDNELW